MIRIDACADPSLAARREASRLGIAIEAMIPIIVTTISSSMSEKPRLVSCSIFAPFSKIRSAILFPLCPWGLLSGRAVRVVSAKRGQEKSTLPSEESDWQLIVSLVANRDKAGHSAVRGDNTAGRRV